jgi:hypothetical protein
VPGHFIHKKLEEMPCEKRWHPWRSGLTLRKCLQ